MALRCSILFTFFTFAVYSYGFDILARKRTQIYIRHYIECMSIFFPFTSLHSLLLPTNADNLMLMCDMCLCQLI